jgi:hypothetical protein
MQRANDIKIKNKNKKEHQIPEFGKPYPHESRSRKVSKFDVIGDITVVPVEIEIDSMLYNLIDNVILRHIDPAADKMSFEEWVNICFKERMDQILTDPKEFGKLLLNPIRKANCLPEVEIKEE